MMVDPSMLDPNVYQAAKAAGLENVDDLNHNGKVDIQDVALAQAAMPTSVVVGQTV
jgi:hypothetical protein